VRCKHGSSNVKSVVARLCRWAWFALAAAVLVLVMGSTPAVSRLLQSGLEGQPQAQSARAYARADAIVVLGGGELLDEVDASDCKSPRATGTRLCFGRSLYQARRAPIILLSGGDGEAAQMAADLAQQGMPRADMLTENRSHDTYENALYSARILRQIGARRILLVTSAIHMRRAAACFRKQGIEVIQAPAPLPDDVPGFWHSRKMALDRCRHCLHEYFGLWLYRICGWT
jgi:uncharacterized SAM-binding protein YcdF (DUF218 family)